MAYAFGPGKIIEDGLVFYVDAANKDSYVSGSSDTFNILNKKRLIAVYKKHSK